MTRKYAPLHLHTEYSLLDGYCKIDRLIEKAKELDLSAVAITDHGAMHGVVQFYKKAKAAGIHPVIGCEIYVSKGDYRLKDKNEKEYYHLILLAENNRGYDNLMQIVSKGFVEGFYYKPRVDKDVLRQHCEGLICLSACIAGEIPQAILEEDYGRAKELTLEYRDIFGEDNFFLEVQDHGLKEEKIVNAALVRLHNELGVPLVCTNDSHYADQADAQTHDILLCIQTGKTVSEEKRMRFPNDQFYIKSYDEMEELFGHFEGALENTQRIAERCRVELDFNTLHLPGFTAPEPFENPGYLKHLVYKGIHEKYENPDDEVYTRAEKELSVIEEMGFVDYFLIVWDFIAYAKSKKIAVGPGRGSAAGSLVSYALDITGIDPLKYDLLFERFLNPERISMPDIDVDFCYERREEIIEYVKNKYGEDHVAQIVTFGTMAARNSIRDVGRAMDIPYGRVDVVAKMIPSQLGMTIDKALEMNPQLAEECEKDDQIRKMVEYARNVEGMPRHTSTHAAGVVISKEPITNYVPLSRNGDAVVTQYNMIELEELGLLKMDFLGLRNLTVIQDTIALVAENKGVNIDIDTIDENDSAVMEHFTNADTIGIFQFESAGMRAFLKELKPTVFGDLVAANSLFRPGPMNEIPTYIHNKHHPEDVTYLHPKLKPILRSTYGTIVYQEQVMQIVQQLAGFTLGGADTLRRAMGKKKMDVMERERRRFLYGELSEDGEILIPGCVRNGVDEETANKIYDLMIDFAKYAFNKSHSAAYSLVAMQTAWLKHYYPVEYMASLITSVTGQVSQVSLYIHESKKMGIQILPPSINHSTKKFTVEKDSIRFGLLAVKNVGSALIDEIVRSRIALGEYRSFQDFVERMLKSDTPVVNKKAIESLIKVGAFDEISPNRAQLLHDMDDSLQETTRRMRKNVAGQTSLFDSMEGAFEELNGNAGKIADFDPHTKLKYEKELLGVYASGHPLSQYQELESSYSTFSTLELLEEDSLLDAFDQKRVRMLGMIVRKSEKLTKTNQRMAFLTLEDSYGSIELIAFPRIYEKWKEELKIDNIVGVRGTLSISDVEDPKILLNDVDTLEDIRQKSRTLKKENLYLQLVGKDRGKYERVLSVLKSSKGNSPVYLYLKDQNRTIRSDRIRVNCRDPEMIRELTNLLGKENIVIQRN